MADAPLLDPALPALWLEAEQLLEDDRPLLTYLRNCGDLVSDVLRGKASPLETLFPGGSFDLAEDLYQRSSTMRYINGLAAAAIEALDRSASNGGMLRVLEIGAGTGGTTASLLPALPADRTQYVFTDVSDVFIDRARRRFGQYQFVSYSRFDLERDPSEQGICTREFRHHRLRQRGARRRRSAGGAPPLARPARAGWLADAHRIDNSFPLVRHDDRSHRRLAALR